MLCLYVEPSKQKAVRMKLETFKEVASSINKNSRRQFHLLLGNGFSMAYDPSIFSYNALHDFVINMNDADLSTILEVFETRNFEIIMQHLDNFSALISAFGGNSELKHRVDAASKKLKNSLLGSVKSLHPEHIFTIPEEKSAACANFLSIFLQTNGSIYSTNYDLLLYWILMRNTQINHGDGCGRELLNGGDFVPEEEQEWSELTWGINRDTQNVFYLHGALQFFDAGIAVTKEEYNVFNYLIENISDRMDKGEYPIFVTAGDGQQKLTHIKHNEYLTFCYDSLCNIEGSLVTFGFNFGEYDEHIIEAINRAAKQGRKIAERLWSIYIGVYSDVDKEHIEEISHKFKCNVHMYDAKTAPVWN